VLLEYDPVNFTNYRLKFKTGRDIIRTIHADLWRVAFMEKSAIASIISIVVALTCLLGFVGCERKSEGYIIANKPSVTGIDSGEINSSTGLEVSKKLNKSNGKYVNLYVENNGSNPVVATINGQSERTFQPDEKGRISLEVTQTFWGGDREYVFKVVPGTNGGSVNIHYEIDRRDEIRGLCDYSEDTGR